MFTTKSECNTQANKQSTNFVSELCRGFVWKHWYADEGAWQMATTPFSSIQPVPPLTPPFPVCWPPSVWTDSNPTGISQVLFSPSTRQTKQSQGLCREESIEVMRVSHEVGWGVEYSSRIMCVDQSQPAGQGNKWGNNCLFRWGGGSCYINEAFWKLIKRIKSYFLHKGCTKKYLHQLTEANSEPIFPTLKEKVLILSPTAIYR